MRRKISQARRLVVKVGSSLLVGKDGDEFRLRLADARDIQVTPYATGYKTGVKIVLDHVLA